MDRPICKTKSCNKSCKYNGFKKCGSRKYYKYCSCCLKVRYKDNYKPTKAKRKAWPSSAKVYPKNTYAGYRKKSKCEKCGFKAVHRCQLDVDHIDGNHYNNNHDNLQTLCANCHRLKTWENGDNKKGPSF